MINLKRHTKIALGYFFIVALLGLLLRLLFVIPMPINFAYVLHAHSHTALLGWLYLGMTTLIYKAYLEKAGKPRHYNWLFAFTNLCVLGMLFSFPFEGYALLSIIFSSLFLFASYWFTWFAITYVPHSFKSRFSWKLVRAGLFYLVFSSLGAWAIGPITVALGVNSSWHNNAIYFYLHFLYNGWFMLVLLGLLFYVLEERGAKFDPKKTDRFYILLNQGVFLSLFLSALWAKPHPLVYVLGGLGAVFQILAFISLFKMLMGQFQVLKSSFGKYASFLLKLTGIFLFVKILMQLLSVIPYFAEVAFEYNDFVIGYLHLVFLGIIVPALLVFLNYFKWIPLPKTVINLYLIGFFTTEILIFYRAMAMWLGLPTFMAYYGLLALLTCLFPISIGCLLYKSVRFPIIRSKRGRVRYSTEYQ